MNLNQTQRALTTVDFVELGNGDGAYYREVLIDNEPGYAIFSAAGETIGIAPDEPAALAAIDDHGLAPITLH